MLGNQVGGRGSVPSPGRSSLAARRGAAETSWSMPGPGGVAGDSGSHFLKFQGLLSDVFPGLWLEEAKSAVSQQALSFE